MNADFKVKNCVLLQLALCRYDRGLRPDRYNFWSKFGSSELQHLASTELFCVFCTDTTPNVRGANTPTYTNILLTLTSNNIKTRCTDRTPRKITRARNDGARCNQQHTFTSQLSYFTSCLFPRKIRRNGKFSQMFLV